MLINWGNIISKEVIFPCAYTTIPVVATANKGTAYVINVNERTITGCTVGNYQNILNGSYIAIGY